MLIDIEISEFNEHCALLSEFLNELAQVEQSQLEQKHWFLAEAVCFRLYRIYERLVRASFLHFCVEKNSICGTPVESKLFCPDRETAENILKSGNKFLDWGNVESTRKLANLVFEDGFPINDFVSPIASSLTDLQRFRNYVAHDSREAADGFKRSRTHYVKVGHTAPETVGELALYRKSALAEITMKILHQKVSTLGQIMQSI